MVAKDAHFLRNYTDVQLPINGSMPRLTVPVVDGFSCHFCGFLTISRAKV